MFEVCDVAEAVATRKDRFLKRYVLSKTVTDNWKELSLLK